MRLLVAFVLVCVSLVSFSPAGSIAQTTGCDGNFQIVHRFPFDRGTFSDIDFSTSEDGWAVGNDYGNNARRARPAVVRFNETSEERVQLPQVEGRPGLAGVAAISPDDVWAVGARYRAGSPESFAMHWDGSTFRTSQVPSPGRYSQLFDVVAFSPDDVWAVGGWATEDRAWTFVVHFDGTSWENIAAPSPNRRGAMLFSIDGSSPLDIWAGGYTGNGQPLVLRWDGLEWERVQLDSAADSIVYDVASASPTDTWVVGGSLFTRSEPAFAAHWNGVEWGSPPVPSMKGPEIFAGAYADTSGAWAVGARIVRRTVLKARAARWDGSAWTNVAIEGDPESLSSVTGDGAGGIWTAGDRVGPDELAVLEKACLP